MLYCILSLPACWFLLSIALTFIYLHFSHFGYLLFNPFIWIIPVKLNYNNWYRIYYIKVISGRRVSWFWPSFSILNDSPSVTDGSKCSKSDLLGEAVAVSSLPSRCSEVGCQLVIAVILCFRFLKILVKRKSFIGFQTKWFCFFNLSDASFQFWSDFLFLHYTWNPLARSFTLHLKYAPNWPVFPVSAVHQHSFGLLGQPANWFLCFALALLPSVLQTAVSFKT